jgi:hypothetical protein
MAAASVFAPSTIPPRPMASQSPWRTLIRARWRVDRREHAERRSGSQMLDTLGSRLGLVRLAEHVQLTNIRCTRSTLLRPIPN